MISCTKCLATRHVWSWLFWWKATYFDEKAMMLLCRLMDALEQHVPVMVLQGYLAHKKPLQGYLAHKKPLTPLGPP